MSTYIKTILIIAAFAIVGLRLSGFSVQKDMPETYESMRVIVEQSGL
ncbi:hypothetical protein 1992IndM4_0465 [Vibrio phage ICP1]|nr:hypothetical protein 1992IndM4_0465 [Vibrio phage ICP1]